MLVITPLQLKDIGGSRMLIRPGPAALSHFRLERLQTKMNYVIPQVTGLSARFMHFIDTEDELTKEEYDVLSNLLAYGSLADLKEMDCNGSLLLVLPKKGSVSAWSSKATDILHYCGLKKVRRIERGVQYCVKSTEKLTWGDQQLIANIVHDQLTESVFFDLEQAKSLFERHSPKPLQWIELLAEGQTALLDANQRLNLNLTPKDIEYFFQVFEKLDRNPSDVELKLYSEFNSEQSRHKIFNAQWVIDGKFKSQSLLRLIRNTYHANSRGILSAYQDNAAVMVGGEGGRFFSDPKTHIYQYHLETISMIIKAESPNYRLNVSPYPEAAMGVGGELRDESATGRGGKPKGALTGLSVSNLLIPGFIQPWEHIYGKPKEIDSALEILLDAPIGAAEFNNEFGRPTICGYFRTFEQGFSDQFGQKVWGYHKPVIISGGLGNIRKDQAKKTEILPGLIIGVLGGVAKNPEMQRRCQEVIETCTAMGIQNPIASIHDVSIGGLGNALAELIGDSQRGCYIELRDIPNNDESLSPLEILCSESPIAYVLALDAYYLEVFKTINNREACHFSVIGKVLGEPILHCHDQLFENSPLKIPMGLLFENPRPERRESWHRSHSLISPIKIEDFSIEDAAFRLLRLPCIADKSFLITITDRSVTGLVVRDQMVGPWQVPVADCAVMARSFEGYQGEAMAMGERPPIALINPVASVRMAIGEAITNIAAANIGVLSDVRLSANWMAACGHQDEDANLYEAVEEVGLTFCPALGMTIPVGKDSLSMQTTWEEKGQFKQVTSPLSLVVSAFAPVMDVRLTLTPELVTTVGDTVLMLIEFSGEHRLGGSALATVYNHLGGSVPDIEDPIRLKSFFASIQQLNMEEKILAYHDRSDGGLFVTLCEMAFAGHIGLQIDLSELAGLIDPKTILFNEELGAVLQVRLEDVESVLAQFEEQENLTCAVIGTLDETDKLTFIHNDNILFSKERTLLQKAWSETSFHLQTLRDNPRCAKKQFESIEQKNDPGLTVHLTFEVNDELILPMINTGVRPKIAILREQGISGHLEMAAAFEKAHFECVDVHMNDLQAGVISLQAFKGLAVCDGFSFGDALGAGSGWAKRILFNPFLKEQFEAFFNRKDTFSLGVCNGCQMLAHLKEIIPGADLWPNFVGNFSGQFEARVCLVEIQKSYSVFFEGMEGSRLMVPVAHRSGRVEFSNETDEERALKLSLVSLQYVDHWGRKTKGYPANPNGSPQGITGLTTIDGRATILMPRPERAFRTVQHSWHPKSWKEEGPWLKFFQNARLWVE